MSFSKSTPHFGLPQYQDNDPQSVPQWNTDITEAFAKIDEVLYTSQDKADQAIGGVQEAVNAADAAEMASNEAKASADNAVSKVNELASNAVVINPKMVCETFANWNLETNPGSNLTITLDTDTLVVFHCTAKPNNNSLFYIDTPVTPSQRHMVVCYSDALNSNTAIGNFGQIMVLKAGTYKFNGSVGNSKNFAVYKVVTNE